MIGRQDRGSAHWSADGVFDLNVHANTLSEVPPFIDLKCTTNTWADGWFDLNQRIYLVQAPTNFGGRRWLFE